MVSEVQLDEATWHARAMAHAIRADALSQGWRDRVASGTKHPVDDFLFTYYPLRPGLLRRWHPGAGVVLSGAATDDRAAWRWYVARGSDLIVDAHGFVAKNERSLAFIRGLLSGTAARQANFACFGLHEWAMVYRSGEEIAVDHSAGGRRHDVPLRLTQSETDSVVEANRIVCSHFDAYRFFTPEAIPLNSVALSRETQPDLEQPGCLHAGMDVYKWVTKLGPLTPGELLLDSFDLARDIRNLDMRASPYDLSDWGYSPVRIESTEGRAEYARAQRTFADRSNVLRTRAVEAIDRALSLRDVIGA